ncbi:MAG: hypothetical protein FJW40_00455 [Acidobacteria bacterium]|nr:hypothetical protein [Acidobacteriota bacterium]
MTNTLHRFGDAESFHDDVIVFAMCAKGLNDDGSVPRLKRFLSLALPFKPVNMGDGAKGGSMRPNHHLNPRAHWDRDRKPDFQVVIDGLDKAGTAAVVFDNRQNAMNFVRAVKEADLGLCVNISTSIEGAEQILEEAGLCRHSVNYSLGFQGKTEKLPNSQVLTLSTMCGHGMISNSMAKKMIDWVKEGRRTPEEAVSYLARFCVCGVFNPVRAQRVIEDARTKMK